MELLEKIVDYSLNLGADYVDVRFEEKHYEKITVDNGVLKEYSITKASGLGVRVLVDGFMGFTSTNNLSWGNVRNAIQKAIELAKALKNKGRRFELYPVKAVRDKRKSPYKINPFDIEPGEKVKLLLDLNKLALAKENIRSAITGYGALYDHKIYVSSEGAHIELDTVMTGILQVSIACWSGKMERVVDSKSRIAGYEFIKETEWDDMVNEASSLALEAVKASTPPPGTYTVILAPEVVGLLLHEAFGHASEGDIVDAGASVLAGKIGEKVASELVTVVDEGVVEGGKGYYHPYDDEGVPKGKTVIVENGVLKTFLTSRYIARRLDLEPTGNGRAQDYAHTPIVRQTNYYIMPGDMKLEELLEDVKYGLYVTGKGAMGGEVNTGTGTFTFSVGVSRVIRNGELCEYVRGVSLSGSILETLKYIDGVGKDLVIRTNVFGGCGKGGQRVHVGHGGPHVRVKKIVVGGR